MMRLAAAAVGMAGALVLARAAAGYQVVRVRGGKVDAVHRGHDMVKLPRGSFLMGSSSGEIEWVAELCTREVGERFSDLACDEQFMEDELAGARRVALFGLWMDRFEVTVGEYRACVASGGCAIDPLLAVSPEPAPPAASAPPPPTARELLDDLPMVGVTWYEAAAYCRAQHKRLPTEAEWEYAARGPESRRWPWGSGVYPTMMNHGGVVPEQLGAVQTVPMYGVDENDGQRYRAPVGSYPGGRSVFGVEDLAGNVAEWVSDWYDAKTYGSSDTMAPRGPGNGTFKVLRGGSYLSPLYRTRGAAREALPPRERAAWIGFRCARDLH